MNKEQITKELNNLRSAGWEVVDLHETEYTLEFEFVKYLDLGVKPWTKLSFTITFPKA